jgi:hypothetical protein
VTTGFLLVIHMFTILFGRLSVNNSLISTCGLGLSLTNDLPAFAFDDVFCNSFNSSWAFFRGVSS